MFIKSEDLRQNWKPGWIFFIKAKAWSIVTMKCASLDFWLVSSFTLQTSVNSLCQDVRWLTPMSLCKRKKTTRVNARSFTIRTSATNKYILPQGLPYWKCFRHHKDPSCISQQSIQYSMTEDVILSFLCCLVFIGKTS